MTKKQAKGLAWLTAGALVDAKCPDRPRGPRGPSKGYLVQIPAFKTLKVHNDSRSRPESEVESDR